MADAMLILNAGSSSLKFSVFAADDGLDLVVRGQVDAIQTSPRFRAGSARGEPLAEHSWERGDALGHRGAVEFVLAWLGRYVRDRRVVAAGHRVVHGGMAFAGPARIDPGVLNALRGLVPLAPLHQPQNIAAIETVAALAPALPQVACFDTAFHAGQPRAAREFAIPRRYTDAGVVRYGFHGLSYEFIASALPSFEPEGAKGRVMVAHLGHGASLCAMHAGRSIATTMGFTALDGLVMGTRCGSIDPGVLIHLARRGLTPDQIEHLLYEESGLLGVSGISADMRTLLESQDPRARGAIDLFLYRAAREVGSLAAALGGLDALVFTGGIGENAAPIRAAICRACAWLGLDVDEPANARHGPRISAPGSRVGAWVIPTNEELTIARHTARLLGLAADKPSTTPTAPNPGGHHAER